MKTDYVYWETFVNYLKDNFKLNGDLANDAKVIKETQYLWQEASKRYLKKISSRVLSEMWCDFNKEESSNYSYWYKYFVEYLNYSTDRMTINRWLSLQCAINRASDLVYNKWNKENGLKKWVDLVENGWNDDVGGLTTNLQSDCSNEFKTIIKPLIIKNQEKGNEN